MTAPKRKGNGENMKSLIYGVGVNDLDELTQWKDSKGNRVFNPYYTTWKDILKRCYSPKYQERYPSYIGCTVTKDWHLYSNFKTWMLTQKHKSLKLDKNILYPNNKLYSPETCCFATGGMIKMLNNKESKGTLPKGITFNKATGKYIALISINGKNKYAGCSATVNGAESAYLYAKLCEIKRQSNLTRNKHIKQGLNRHLELISEQIAELL